MNTKQILKSYASKFVATEPAKIQDTFYAYITTREGAGATNVLNGDFCNTEEARNYAMVVT